MTNFILKDFPEKEELLMAYRQDGHTDNLEVNCHLHSPYSFSSFDSIQAIFKQADDENIKVLGINDFFNADGYEEFYQNSLEHRIFPLFNIEIVGLLKDEQDKNFRINDPNNPGRIYISGKGLDFPFELDPAMECMLKNVRYESQLHVKEIVEQANQFLGSLNPAMKLKFSEIKRVFARDYVTERHVARAIRTLIFEKIQAKSQRHDFLDKISKGLGKDSDNQDIASLENGIRSNFLKSGGMAFIAESAVAFLPLSDVVQIILNAGGIPCYTVLLDNESGLCTEYEANKQILMNELLAHNIHCIEFIPFRNDAETLENYADYFEENGFIVLFGTAHSTPDLIPLRITSRGGIYLNEKLSGISFQGASMIAAHQYLRAKGKRGYLDLDGNPAIKQREDFVELGKSVIYRFLNM
jgi:hypothetical protein